jgi:hypothetical protein
MTKRTTALRAKAAPAKTETRKSPNVRRPSLSVVSNAHPKPSRLDVNVKALPFPKDDTVQVTLTLPADLWAKTAPLLSQRGLELSDFLRASLRTLPERKLVYGLQMALQLGKYKGEVLETIIRLDPTYIQWMIKNVERFAISEQAFDLLDELLTTKQEQYA